MAGAATARNRGGQRARRHDAIVVGAGPAGSTAAYRLAAAGADVLLLDRARFPRDKPCGGGVTARALRVLPVAIDPVVEEVVTRVELRLRYGRRIERGSGAPLAYMTQRRRLDALLVERAVEAGASFRDGVRVTAVESGADGVTVVAGGERLAAAALVAADGANGVCGPALGLGGNRSVGVALEGNVPYAKLGAEWPRASLLLELDTVPGGYGWIFPKGDHANLGVGGWASEGPRLRAHLRRLCEAHGLRLDDLEGVRGHRLPMRAPASTLARGRSLVVGDAAGLVDPVSGDGMFEGFLSAQYAAEAVLDLVAGRAASLEPYGPRLGRRLAPHLWASWSLKAALERFPRVTFAIAGTGAVWGVIERLLRGDLTDVSGVRGLARPPLKALAVLARAAGDPGRAFRSV